ncbi:MAG: hypothetical protein RL406_51, partial [Pseudomonadota bacterium]
ECHVFLLRPQHVDHVAARVHESFVTERRFAHTPQHHGGVQRHGVEGVASHAPVLTLGVSGHHGHAGGEAAHRVFDVHAVLSELFLYKRQCVLCGHTAFVGGDHPHFDGAIVGVNRTHAIACGLCVACSVDAHT